MVSETTLKVDEGAENVTYTYDCGERQATYGTPAETGKLMMPCTLQINWKNADGPAAPVLELDYRFANSIFVKRLGDGYEYRINGGDWQNLHYFSDLQPGTEYTITARAKGTATHEPGAVSKPLIVTTLYDMIPDDLKDKLGAVVSAYIAEYDGKEHEAVIVDMNKMPKGWRITGYATGDEDNFGPQKPMIRNVSDSSLIVKTHFAHEDYAQSLIVYSYARITPKPLNNNMIADIPDQLYTGKPIHPKPKIKDGDMDLEEGRDFTYSYDTNTSPEQGGTVTITGMGNYKDTASKHFTIVNEITEITEDDLKDLEIPTLVTVKCTTTNSSKEYGRIPGGFDLSKTELRMEGDVWKAIVHLNLLAYKDKYNADTNKMHEYIDLQGNLITSLTLKYVDGKWQPEGILPNLILLVQCDGNHPQEYTITFDGNGGALSVDSMKTVNQKLPKLPTATHSGRYSFDGWYTAASGGTMITTDTEFHENTTVYAHWTYTGSSGGSSSGRTYHTIKASSDSNGSISPSERVSVRHGRDQSFTITPDKGYEIAKVLVDGKSVGAVESYTFKSVTKNHTIEAIFMKVDDNKPLPDTFMDVPKGSYYEKAVDWAVKNGITAGTGDNYFMPDGICTRAQAVTFLWRVAGSPTPKTEVMPVEDVPEGSYYYEAVLWATENEITVGTSATTFSPELTCSRAHIVSFLWRAAGYPSAGTVNPFTDVPENAYYINAMLWAVKQEITVGTTPSTFSPDEGCTRAQIVTFLYRARSM
ncbi:S-layer homology domain-containing protein [Anaerotignum faecicola]